MRLSRLAGNIVFFISAGWNSQSPPNCHLLSGLGYIQANIGIRQGRAAYSTYANGIGGFPNAVILQIIIMRVKLPFRRAFAPVGAYLEYATNGAPIQNGAPAAVSRAQAD
ncbi:MAG: hypothetical protein BHW65_04715 [Verrucomicrobia bacterium CAG:312_58_20]|nr:MAG: hypothetical protein BHW65_04715 [Verrucomicrobia bacterium CAG:312_58_20]